MNEEPLILNEHLKEHINENNATCKTMSKENIMLECKGCDEMSSHSNICIEQTNFSEYDDKTCRHCCYKNKEDNTHTCINCYENEMLN